MEWTIGQVKLGKYRNRTPSRVGFVNEHGVTALPPRNRKRLNEWFEKMKISPQSREAYLSMAA